MTKRIKLLTIIIPVFNEERTIVFLLSKVLKQKLKGWKKEIIIVDDGSTDNSIRIVRKLQNSLSRRPAPQRGEQAGKFQIYKQKHRGRGSALRLGITKAKGDIIIFQDADLEYDPKDYPKLLEPFADPNCKVVYGTRTVNPKFKGYWFNVLGVRFLTFIVNFIYGTRLTDIYTGYKLFRTNLIKSLDLISNGFELEVELTSKIIKKGIQIKEVPIYYIPRSYSEGKKVNPWDGIKGFLNIIKYRFLSSLFS